MSNSQEIKLILEDGTVFEGKSFGYAKSVSGEVVFNTAMTGYTESLTDPSYKGQILVSTYPLVGNYGVPGDDMENGMHKFYESDRVQVSAFIVSDYSFEHSHWNAKKSLAEWLIENQVPGIYGIDTRALTKILREKGTMLGKIVCCGQDVPLYNPGTDNVVAQVSCKEKIIYGTGSNKIMLVDTGVKNNIIRCFLKRDTTVIRVPWDYDYSAEDYDGLFLSNGPGDPKMCKETIEVLKKAIVQDKPIFGICLGNLLLGLACGGDTYKLKYGHRSHNQPAQQVGTDKCVITSQNHGYTVDLDTLSSDWEPFFVNANDGTCEGLKHKKLPFFSTQFHPEASSGPTDTEYLFDEFIELVEKKKNKN
jgi:carbamoyl-phosphate synthase small subunit